jgi:hypothetical protein
MDPRFHSAVDEIDEMPAEDNVRKLQRRKVFWAMVAIAIVLLILL